MLRLIKRIKELFPSRAKPLKLSCLIDGNRDVKLSQSSVPVLDLPASFKEKDPVLRDISSMGGILASIAGLLRRSSSSVLSFADSSSKSSGAVRRVLVFSANKSWR
mmetsp:Transcript_4599/g.13857  ORF Transcript_4599/g.13857 Transcript_4599/m.13857 type:complete len:106 (+) Transcript_4599:409-726(+)